MAATEAVINPWLVKKLANDKNSASVLAEVLINPTDPPLIVTPLTFLVPDVSG